MVYELYVTNFSSQPTTLKSVEVLTGDDERRVLFTLSDSALTQNMARPGAAVPAAERAKIAGGLRALVFLWGPLPADSQPAAIRHRVKLGQGSGDSTRTQEFESAAGVAD